MSRTSSRNTEGFAYTLAGAKAWLEHGIQLNLVPDKSPTAPGRSSTNPVTELPRPDLSDRPHQCSIERQMSATPAAIYHAWTEGFDSWFAAPGLIQMHAAQSEPYVFYTEHEGQLQPHYGRFLSLHRHRLVELTWMTGAPGTAGAETIVTVELEPNAAGTRLRLTYAGFYDQASADRHDQAWEHHVLPHLDATLAAW